MKKVRYIQAVLGIITLGFALLVMPTPAHAISPWVIWGYDSKKCYDVPGYSIKNEVRPVIWPCATSPRQTNQQWTFEYFDGPWDEDTYQIKNVHSDKCIDVMNASAADNAPVIQYTCKGGVNQFWIQDKQFSLNGRDYYWFVNIETGKCLTVANKSVANGAQLVQFTCNGGANQYFTWQS